jgi:hypothetical protein
MQKYRDLDMTEFFENIKLVSTGLISYRDMTYFQTGKKFD